jgi:hypothetical protein
LLCELKAVGSSNCVSSGEWQAPCGADQTDISIRPDMLGEVIRGLQEAERKARADELIPD